MCAVCCGVHHRWGQLRTFKYRYLAPVLSPGPALVTGHWPLIGRLEQFKQLAITCGQQIISSTGAIYLYIYLLLPLPRLELVTQNASYCGVIVDILDSVDMQSVDM